MKVGPENGDESKGRPWENLEKWQLWPISVLAANQRWVSVNNLGKGNSTAVMKIFVDDEHDDDDNVVMDGDMW